MFTMEIKGLTDTRHSAICAVNFQSIIKVMCSNSFKIRTKWLKKIDKLKYTIIKNDDYVNKFYFEEYF